MSDQFASADWLRPLLKKLESIREARVAEIAAIGDTFGDPLGLARFYVEPECQQYNPADFHEDDPSSVVRSPIFKTINAFLSGVFAVRDGRQQMIVLADAGMGKTSLLVMLKLIHLTSFWPQGHDCRLMKLGPNTLNEVAKFNNKANTVLLLDSLDEDSLAFGRSEERLLEILSATQNFRRVIISCRTQFFPEHGVTPFKTPGKIQIGGFQCPMIFLSLFDDLHVEEYLSRRFSPGLLDRLLGRMPAKHDRAGALVGKMKSLRFRPLLLAHIEDLVDSQLASRDDYSIYDALVLAWLLREERKLKVSNPHNATTATDLLNACSLVAYSLWCDRTPEARQEQIGSLVRQNSHVTHLYKFDFGGRSLLNRSSSGGYRFAHFSIQEYLVVRAALATQAVAASVTATAQMALFLRGWVDEGEIERRDWSDRVPSGIGLMQAVAEAKSLRRSTVDSPLTGAVPPKRRWHLAPVLGLKQVIEKESVELVCIPGGSFRMGSPDTDSERHPDEEEPQHEVTLSAFYLGRFPVTNAQYRAFLAANPRIAAPSWLKDALDDHPVVNISWDNAMSFAEWAGARLPTEAEWEYACRAGTLGSRYGKLDEIAWHLGNSGGRPHPVGQKQANSLGLYDMLGNVWEWCFDRYGRYTPAAQTNPDGPRATLVSQQRVFRGGSWSVPGSSVRAASRHCAPPDYRLDVLGFRLAQSTRPEHRG